MTILILFAFLSGVVTIFAPCIWPILPIVLSVGASGGERKPLGVVTGLAVSFMLITLTLASVVKVIPIDPNTLRLSAIIVIGILGLTLIVPAFGVRLESLVSRLGGLGTRFMHPSGSGFWGGFLTGSVLGIVWSPCAGPILATVATLAATQAVNVRVVLVTAAFVLGVATPLYGLALAGQRILAKTRALSRHGKRIQQVFGVVMILAAGAIYTGYDQVLQVRLLAAFPRYGNFLNGFETNDTVREKLDEIGAPKQGAGSFSVTPPVAGAKSSLPDYGPAPEFAGITGWLNTDGTPLTMKSLRGKVVLVDFWTYSCINCIRTLPYVTAWYDTYKDQGFVVVGVHTPEFEFEKKTSNVEGALGRFGIRYPVAQDNGYGTWQAYGNKYWPAHYLIDADGEVRGYHFGEGGYAETEHDIRALLAETGKNVGSLGGGNVAAETPGTTESPETYLGSKRMERLVSPERPSGGDQSFTAPPMIPQDAFAYTGTWRVESERAVAQGGAGLSFHFEGKKVYLVMAPPDGAPTGSVRVDLDGMPVGSDRAGKDVTDGMLTVDGERLYELIDLRGMNGKHVLDLRFVTSGTKAYAFTFS